MMFVGVSALIIVSEAANRPLVIIMLKPDEKDFLKVQTCVYCNYRFVVKI